MTEDLNVSVALDGEVSLANASIKGMLDAMMSLSANSGLTVVQHGARLAVIGELLGALLAALPAPLRGNVETGFRQRVEDLLAITDDKQLPEQYHSALLTEVNRYLNALRQD